MDLIRKEEKDKWSVLKVGREIQEKREKERKSEIDKGERRKRNEKVSDNTALSVDANNKDSISHQFLFDLKATSARFENFTTCSKHRLKQPLRTLTT